MEDLRLASELALAETLEGEFGIEFEFENPNGTIINKSANNPTQNLRGQWFSDTIVENPETGGRMMLGKPNITARNSSLSSAPSDIDYNRWFIKVRPSINTSVKKRYKLETPPLRNDSIGFTSFVLTEVIQS